MNYQELINEIERLKLVMKKGLKPKAYRDTKKHYDKLVRERKEYEKYRFKKL